MARMLILFVVGCLCLWGPSAKAGFVGDIASVNIEAEGSERSTGVGDFVEFWTYAGTPQSDFTALSIESGQEILTGGPLKYGSMLSGIFDITGPDLGEIISAIESKGYWDLSGFAIGRYRYLTMPALPFGIKVENGGAVAFDLWPDELWIIGNKSDVLSKMDAFHPRMIVPEPASAILLTFGFVLVGLRRR